MGIVLSLSVSARAQNIESASITELFTIANRYLAQEDYRGAIPVLREVVRRTGELTDINGITTAQNSRFELARAYYKIGSISNGMDILNTYLSNQPCREEAMAVRMVAQGYFDEENWEKVEQFSRRLLTLSGLDKEDRYNGSLLLGQALFRQDKWGEAIAPLARAAKLAENPKEASWCNILQARALVEQEDWGRLYGLVSQLYRTDAKYDITLNLTLMQAGKARYDDEDYLNALLLYRMVLPREKLLAFSDRQLTLFEEQIEKAERLQRSQSEVAGYQDQIDRLQESKEALLELPAYEDEVLFRIGQIYAEVKRYWEAFVLFDHLYEENPTGEIGEGSLLQSALVLYDLSEVDRAAELTQQYLTRYPEGTYVRELLSLLIRNRLMRQDYAEVIATQSYVDQLPAPDAITESELQSELHYMVAFGYFQSRRFREAYEQFSVVVDAYQISSYAPDALYYRGMASLMQADYAQALNDFKRYQVENPSGEHVQVALFREGVASYGLDELQEAERLFSQFISSYEVHPLLSEVYSMRGDIEAAKEYSLEDPHTLDRAVADYRKGIDTASLPTQASYAAFQAAKVYELEEKWTDIIDLMRYYIDRWEEEADVAEATFWMGRSLEAQDQVETAIQTYLEAIERFGNFASQSGVDRIIMELKELAFARLSEEERVRLSAQLAQLDATLDDEQANVLKYRLQTAQAYLNGSEIYFAQSLLEEGVNFADLTPVSLALLSDQAGGVAQDQIEPLYSHFTQYYPDSPYVWKAYKAFANDLAKEQEYTYLLRVIEEAQSLFGADEFMAWAQLLKANAQYQMGRYEEAEADYNLILGVADWRGPAFAEAMHGMGRCREAQGDLESAHSLYQRTYLLFKSYEEGLWAAKGYLAAVSVLEKMGLYDEAENTRAAMFEDTYTRDHPLVKEQRVGVEEYVP